MIGLIVLLFIIGLLSFFRAGLGLASTAVIVWLLALSFYAGINLYLWAVLLLVLLTLNVPALRRKIISAPVYQIMRRALPEMSQTEREALEAGDTWWDAELFSGQPDWKVLLDMPAAELSAEEQAFIDGPVEQLCAMLNDWDITHNRRDLPPEIWDFIKQNKFCGMIIPKQYGGLEFSHYAHSQVVMKIASRSSTTAVTVMVPNSLGPAKLLLSYGTAKQKQHYLPKLATGEEMPCFALTGPKAGSDAGAMPDNGVVCRDAHDTLGIRLNWEKRYITLGPVATVLGLAFKLYDPEHLLGYKENIGITVALIPVNTPGISIGRRHFPLDSAFQNGPNWGKDVFIPLDWVIGGADQVGKGWKMLMQSLTTGRSISLPALSVAGGKYVCRNSGAYARIRKQFNVAISEFEGIEEPLARMAGETYLMNAAREVTLAALDHGRQPAVISAIIKYELTERMRAVVNDAMDIQGGSGICLGPKNFIGRLYQVIPVCITVEGANILTRTMMIFGQGAVRCHPFIQQEMAALHNSDDTQGLEQFDALFLKHIGAVLHNFAAGFWLSLTNARFYSAPGDHQTVRYFRQIARLSVGFALLADYALLTLGGALKRRERLSGRFADVLSNLYLCSTVLKYYQDQGARPEDLPLLNWACQHTIYRAQQALLAIFWKLPFRPVVWLLRALLFPLGKPYAPPGDPLIHDTAATLTVDSAIRERLTQGIYINSNADDPTGRIELAFKAVLAAAPVERKIRRAQKQKLLLKGNVYEQLDAALLQTIITREEAELLEQAEKARMQAISVDDFAPEELTGVTDASSAEK